MRSMYLRFCLIGILFCTFLSITAQTSEWINLHKGNVAFKSGDMATAEKAYRQALKENPRNARAAFNLGDVYLSNKDAQNALKYYSSAAKLEKSKVVRAMAYHNMGYIHQVSKNYDRAIGYYKEAPAQQSGRQRHALQLSPLPKTEEAGRSKQTEQPKEQPTPTILTNHPARGKTRSNRIKNNSLKITNRLRIRHPTPVCRKTMRNSCSTYLDSQSSKPVERWKTHNILVQNSSTKLVTHNECHRKHYGAHTFPIYPCFTSAFCASAIAVYCPNTVTR